MAPPPYLSVVFDGDPAWAAADGALKALFGYHFGLVASSELSYEGAGPLLESVDTALRSSWAYNIVAVRRAVEQYAIRLRAAVASEHLTARAGSELQGLLDAVEVELDALDGFYFDGTKDGGNQGFFFLPPVAWTPVEPPADLDESLLQLLFIDVCELNGSHCSDDPVAVLTDDTGVHLSSEKYGPHFVLSALPDLNPEADQLRFTVRVGPVELGYADLTRAWWGESGATGEPRALRFTVGTNALASVGAAVIGEEGAELTTPGGGRLEFPVGALSTRTVIQVREIEAPVSLPSRYATMGFNLDVNLGGAELFEPAVLFVPFDLDLLDPDTLAISDLRVGLRDDSADDWDFLPVSRAPLDNGLVVEIPHFTDVVVVEDLVYFTEELVGDGYHIRWRPEGIHAPLSDDLYEGQFGIPGDAIGIPEYIVDLAVAVSFARQAYEDLGFALPPTINVMVVTEVLGPTGAEIVRAMAEGFGESCDIRGSNFVSLIPIGACGTDFAWIDNDQAELQRFNTLAHQVLPLVTAHEIFHVVQNQYWSLSDLPEEEWDAAFESDAWLHESSARWMENVLFDDVRDFSDNEFAWYDLPSFGEHDESLLEFDGRYRHFPFFQFLEASVGIDGIIDIFEEQEAGESIQALRQGLEGLDLSLSDVWADYVEMYRLAHNDAFGEYSEWAGFIETRPFEPTAPAFAFLPTSAEFEEYYFASEGPLSGRVYELDDPTPGRYSLTIQAEQCLRGRVFQVDEAGELIDATDRADEGGVSQTFSTLEAARVFLVLSSCNTVTADGTHRARIDRIEGVTSDLALHLNFNGDATDSSGNGHDGSTLGGAVFGEDRFGADGSALELDGLDDRVVVPHHPDLNLSANYTISVWVRSTSESPGDNQILAKGSGLGTGCCPGVHEYALWTTNNQNWPRASVGTVSNRVAVDRSISFTAWTHLALSVEEGLGRLFVNGQFAAEAALPAGESTQEDLSIGAFSGLAFAGSIDDVRLYNIALSDEEIAELCDVETTCGADPTVEFRVTPGSMTYSDASSAVCSETFGREYRMADWNDMSDAWESGYDPDEILGPGLNAWVTVDGRFQHTGERHYFATQFPVHAGFAVFDRLGDDFALGSWYSEYRLLCYRDDEPVLPSLTLSVGPTGTQSVPAGGSQLYNLTVTDGVRAVVGATIAVESPSADGTELLTTGASGTATWTESVRASASPGDRELRFVASADGYTNSLEVVRTITVVSSALPPAATTFQESSVTETSFRANGVVNPRGLQTDWWFEFGVLADLAEFGLTPPRSAGNGTGNTAVNLVLADLEAGGTYYYRLVARNEAGTTRGAIETVVLDSDQASYQLIVSRTGSGTGSVLSSPSGISCGADCSESFDEGTSVTLTASPGSGSTFGGWSGACSGTGGCTVTMNTDLGVVANFVSTGSGATLRISFTGLPGGVSPRISVFEEDGSLVGSCGTSSNPCTFNRLDPGRYRVQAYDRVVGESTYQPTPEQQFVDLSADGTETVSVAYSGSS